MHDLRSFARLLATSGLVVVTLAACGGGAAAPTAAPTAVATPSSSPVQTAAPSPTAAQPSAQPSATPVPGEDASPTPRPVRVDLTTSGGGPTHIDVIDWTGTLSGAASGEPGDGASVEPGSLQLRNDFDTSLRITWSAAPCATADRLYLEPGLARITLLSPPCDGDAIALDRVLILYFDQPVDADAIEAVVQTSVDTMG